MTQNRLKLFSIIIVVVLVGGYQIVRYALAPEWSRTASCPSLPDITVAQWCFNGKTEGAKWSISIGTLQGSLIHQTPVLGIDFKGLHHIASSCNYFWRPEPDSWLKDALVIPIVAATNLKVDNGPSGGVAKHAELIFATPKTYYLNLGSSRAEVENRLELIYGDGQDACVDRYIARGVWWLPDSHVPSRAVSAQKRAPKTHSFQIVRQIPASYLLGYYVVPFFGKTKFSTYMENHTNLEISRSCTGDTTLDESPAPAFGSGPGLSVQVSSDLMQKQCPEKRPESFFLPLLQGQSQYLQY